jgi:lysophospholipase L1-like esterase
MVVAAVVALTLTTGATTAMGYDAHPAGWSAAWAAAPHQPTSGDGGEGSNWSLDGFARNGAESVRQVVRVSAAGSQVRIRLSNRFGTQPLRIAGATIAKSAGGAAVRSGTQRPLTFGHRASAVIPTGAELTSDAAVLSVRSLESLTVTLYFTTPTGPATFHELGLATAYRAAGDHRFATRAAAFGQTNRSRYYLTGVDVSGRPAKPASVVAFGDSITDGYGTTADVNNRWPDELAERLDAAGMHFGVANAGINGNKLLADSPCYGQSGTGRFARDVLRQPGVRTVIVLEGLNDIGGGGFPDFGCGSSPKITAADLIEGHRALIRAAHRQGVRILGATLTPIGNAWGYDTEYNQRVRDELNDWIRTSGEYDGVVDLANVLAAPDDSRALNPAYDSGDHLHPNDAGAKAIAAAIELRTL